MRGRGVSGWGRLGRWSSFNGVVAWAPAAAARRRGAARRPRRDPACCARRGFSVVGLPWSLFLSCCVALLPARPGACAHEERWAAESSFLAFGVAGVQLEAAPCCGAAKSGRLWASVVDILASSNFSWLKLPARTVLTGSWAL